MISHSKYEFKCEIEKKTYLSMFLLTFFRPRRMSEFPLATCFTPKQCGKNNRFGNLKRKKRMAVRSVTGVCSYIQWSVFAFRSLLLADFRYLFAFLAGEDRCGEHEGVAREIDRSPCLFLTYNYKERSSFPTAPNPSWFFARMSNYVTSKYNNTSHT